MIAKNNQKPTGFVKDGNSMSGIAKAGNIIFSSKIKIVDFATGTDNQIAKMLEAHYAGKINISDYWHVGDTRLIHINATTIGNKNYVTQDMTMVIMDFDHDDLTAPINGKTKAAVSVGFRETMGNAGDIVYVPFWGGTNYIPVKDSDNYSANPLRTWLNGGLLSALPVTFSSLIKEVNKKNLKYHTKSDEAPLITKDKIWLLSYPEVYGTEIFSNYLGGANPSNYEGEQYEYMKEPNNRKKGVNNNGTPTSGGSTYWLRSPSTYSSNSSGYFWCTVYSAPQTNSNAGGSCLSPAFCL